jgi:hypothetical protein
LSVGQKISGIALMRMAEDWGVDPIDQLRVNGVIQYVPETR